MPKKYMDCVREINKKYPKDNYNPYAICRKSTGYYGTTHETHNGGLKCPIKQSWIEMEKEHTKSAKEASRIVQDHIREHGCGYYPALKNMERHLKKKTGMMR